jgi:hypothetical protein
VPKSAKLQKFGDETSKAQQPGLIDEHDRLAFAKWILGVLALIYVLSWLFNFCTTCTTGQRIIENVNTVVPPIVTFILGHYFARK